MRASIRVLVCSLCGFTTPAIADDDGNIDVTVRHYCNHCGNILTEDDMQQSYMQKGVTRFVRRVFLTLGLAGRVKERGF